MKVQNYQKHMVLFLKASNHYVLFIMTLLFVSGLTSSPQVLSIRS